MIGRVEVIPAFGLWSSLHCNVGASTYLFMAEQYDFEALSIFCNRYVPANQETMSDFFSTKEIQKLIKDHVGIEMDPAVICECLISMHYSYQLEEGNFMWMVKKEY